MRNRVAFLVVLFLVGSGLAMAQETTTGSLTEQLETRARYYGSLIGVRYAEALKRSDFLPRPVRDIGRLL